MKTIILPGYSEHNKKWAEKTAQEMNLNQEVIVHNWRHWSGANFSLKTELESLLKEVGKEKINILAKSVGVYVALKLIPKIPKQVNKILFCGIASVASQDRKDLLRAILTNIPPQDILCIQNKKDKYVIFKEAEKFYHSVEPNLKVISKPRFDHDYPYSSDFKKFFE